MPQVLVWSIADLVGGNPIHVSGFESVLNPAPSRTLIEIASLTAGDENFAMLIKYEDQRVAMRMKPSRVWCQRSHGLTFSVEVSHSAYSERALSSRRQYVHLCRRVATTKPARFNNSICRLIVG